MDQGEITDWPHHVLRKNPKKDSGIGYFDLVRCFVQSFSFSDCFGIRTKNGEGTEIQCRFRDSEVCLNFRKRVGPLRNGKEPVLITIFLPELISDQAVRLPFSNFRVVVCVLALCLKADMDLTEKLETAKGILKSSSQEEIQ